MKKKKILFYDTTLRDGSQMEGISLSLRDKLMIAKRLDRFGMHYLEGGWPGSNPKDMEFFRAIKKAGLRHARVAAFGSTRRPHVKVKDDPQLKALLDAGFVPLDELRSRYAELETWSQICLDNWNRIHD